MILIHAVNTIPQMGDEEAFLRPSVEGGSRMQQTNEFAGHAVEELWFVVEPELPTIRQINCGS